MISTLLDHSKIFVCGNQLVVMLNYSAIVLSKSRLILILLEISNLWTAILIFSMLLSINLSVMISLALSQPCYSRNRTMKT